METLKIIFYSLFSIVLVVLTIAGAADSSEFIEKISRHFTEREERRAAEAAALKELRDDAAVISHMKKYNSLGSLYDVAEVAAALNMKKLDVLASLSRLSVERREIQVNNREFDGGLWGLSDLEE
jgi:molybdenum cofactor biosynthesis enzyme